MSNLKTTLAPAFEDDATSWPGWSIVLEIIYVIIALLGILGNGIVVFALIKVKYLKSFTNVLVTNQSAIDLVSSIMFFALYVLPRPTLPVGNETFTNFVCKFWLSEYPLWAFSVSSTVNLVCLTFDRYFAVIHPVIYRNKFSIGKGKLVCLLPWIIGLLHEVPWMYVHKVKPITHTCEPMWPHDGAQYIFGVIVFINHYVIPLLIMVYVYTRIILRLRRELKQPSTPTSPNTKNADKPKNKRHFATVASRSVLKTMIIVSLSYLICWGPNEVIYLYFNCGNYVDFTSFLVTITVICVLCNMWLNPIIYALNYKELRRGVVDSFSIVTYRIPALRKFGSADRKSLAVKGETLRDTISGNGSVRGGSDGGNKV
ncbi:putative somatostatin-like receptor [Apostichopus japonicus]|uniref:Putative somatostatin-like receptor n=1 Tax=Stichopus japonicus TaxID=307972 RepID=A0A2G8K726_STIJA|nr:putative somatostatin-like receptor [Apostichopus japonicus]